MNSEGKVPPRPRCQSIRQPIEAGGFGPNLTIETQDQKHDVQLAYHFNAEQPLLKCFRDQAPNITLRLSIGTRIDAHGDQRLGNIT